MGCDIHSYVEVQANDGTWTNQGDIFPLDDFNKKWQKKDFGSDPFSDRNYSVFAFLAGVRNYGQVKPISEPKGVPSDLSEEVRAAYQSWEGDAHSASWLYVSELLAVDYDEMVNDRRVTKQEESGIINGGATGTEDEGTWTVLREYLGANFMQDLSVLEDLSKTEKVRVVFWFDN